jgi:hypothetical protein
MKNIKKRFLSLQRKAAAIKSILMCCGGCLITVEEHLIKTSIFGKLERINFNHGLNMIDEGQQEAEADEAIEEAKNIINKVK